MASTDTTAQIKQSLFSRRGEDGHLDENYIAHLKIWEEVSEAPGQPDDGNRKARYLMLAVNKYGKVYLHKAKRNNNGSFSKGKTWNLEDLRQIEVIGYQTFALTMTSRTYVWHTERSQDQQSFLVTMCKIYQKYTQGRLPSLINLDLQHDDATNSYRPVQGKESSQSNLIASEPLIPPQQNKSRQGSHSSIASSQKAGGLDASRSGAYRNRPSQDEGKDSFHTPELYSTSSSAIPASIVTEPGMMYPHPRNQAYLDGPSKSLKTNPATGVFHQQQQHQNHIQYMRESGALETEPAISRDRPAPSGRKLSGAEERTPTQTSFDYREQSVPPRPSPGSGLAGLEQTTSHRGSEPAVSRLKLHEKEKLTVQLEPSSHTPYAADWDAKQSDPSIVGADGYQNESRTELHERRGLTPIITSIPVKPLEKRTPRPEKAPVIPVLQLPEDHADVESEVPRARRASFVPPPQDTPYSRDLLLRGGTFSQTEALLGRSINPEVELEDATMVNVEEILEGFDWNSEHLGNQGAEAIEGRLLDELNALEAANIHAFLESDDRISGVLKGIEDAIAEMDMMDNRISGYKMQLSSVTEDIAFIESQNRGLQVQTANQQALLKELEQLLENVSVDPDSLRSLTQESLESERGIQNLESALATLYKALLAIRDRNTNDLVAAAGRKDEYETHNSQFCQRLMDYLVIMIRFQADTTAADTAKNSSTGEIQPHASMEQKLGQYCGLVLYMIEMDEERYQKLCTNYFSSAAELHSKEIKGMFLALIGKLKRPAEDEKDDSSFTSASAPGARSGAMQRSRAVMVNLRGSEKKEKRSQGHIKAAEALDRALATIAVQLAREEAFISDFLHITDSMLTYADYMDLESYFRRQAMRSSLRGMQPSTVKLRRSALDLIFGSVWGEIKDWVDGALQRDRIQVFGMLAVCEKAIQDAESRNAIFYMNILQRQIQRIQSLVEKYLADQVRTIENTQLTNKKGRGVVFFIKHFPVFVSRIESQLVDYADSAARNIANSGYEQVVNAMFDTLQHMAKMDRSEVAGEDKSQLNHWIIMIENLHFYVQDAAKYDVPALHGFMERAQEMYEGNMSAYIRAVLRRSFGRPWDFFDSVQVQLQTSSAQDVSSNPSYNRSALKRAVKDISSGKEMRKAVDALLKRVEKHYSLDESDLAGTDDAAAMSNEAAALIISVSQSCERLLKAEVAKWSALMAQCYSEAAASGVGLEYGPSDIEVAFKKARG